MELTWEEWKAMRKSLRRQLGKPCWALLIYYIIMNVSVFLWIFVQTIISSVRHAITGDYEAMIHGATAAAESGWGYFLAAAVGLLLLLIWKKPRFWKEEIWAEGKPMGCGSFFALLILFLGCQLLSQIMLIVTEVVLNIFGLTITEGIEALSMDPDNFSMFLYACILAPVTEEILFRGLVQRSLLPYGKKFAIICSALTFGLFHGNLIQTPFAFVAGLVLGYVASEYSIGWAMLLHMINNMLLADSLNRLTSGLTEEQAALIIWGVLLISGIVALVILIVKRQDIRQWTSQERINRTCLKCFFSSAGTIVFMIVLIATMIWTMSVLITPI